MQELQELKDFLKELEQISGEDIFEDIPEIEPINLKGVTA